MRHSPRQFSPIVAIPARNEAQRLPLLIKALACQSWAADQSLSLVIVVNNSTDGSRETALRALNRHTNLAADVIEVDFPEAHAHAGSARRLAMETALARCADDDAVILTTDADAAPDPNWLAANLAALARGADLVGGDLYGDPDEESQLGPGVMRRARAIIDYATLCDRLAALIDPLAHDPWPRHYHHTGGSLAIRAGLYCRIGGLPALPRREDLALVARARAAGGKLVHPLDVRVKVSARLAGRAHGGMADCLKDWVRAEAEAAPVLVEDPNRVLARLKRRRALRIGTEFACAQIELLAPDEPDAPASTQVADASRHLRAMIAELEETTDAA